MNITEKSGIFTHIDDNGNETQLFPRIRTDHVDHFADAVNNLITVGTSEFSNQLSNARSMQVNLTKNDAITFDGSSDVELGVSGILPVENGGTGQASWTENSIIYPNTPSTFTQLAFPAESGSVLRQDTSGSPYWTDLTNLATAMGNVKIETGSYVGVGNSQQNPPNTLTFSFNPKMVMVVMNKESSSDPGLVFLYGQTQGGGISHGSTASGCRKINISWGDKSVTWYDAQTSIELHVKARHQLNTVGETYHYIAIG